MQSLVMPGLKRIYVPCGTKFGKSISASAALANAAVRKKGATWRWIAPFYDQAHIGMDYLRGMMPPPPHTEFIDGKNLCRILYLQSKIEFKHAQKAQALEGAGSEGNVFDEAAKIKFDAVASARTTTTFTKGPEMYISTPLGKGWFYREAMEAKERMHWAVKNCKPVEFAFITARTIDNPYIDKAVVAEARQTLPDRLFRQFYLAEFVDDGSVFLGIYDCIAGQELEIYGANQYYMPDDAHLYEVIIGVDWAKQGDFTVFNAFSIGGGKKPKQIAVQRFHGISYVDQIKELYKFCKKFKNVRIILHDKTGVGEALDDMMAQLPFNSEGVVFTSVSKPHMVSQFMLVLEKREIELLNWPEQTRELEAYTVLTNELGNARYSAPQGLHDDVVSSLILANVAIQEYGTDFKLNFLEDLPKQKQTVESWYRDIIDEDDIDPATHLFS